MNVADRPLIESAKPQGGIITVFDRDHHMTASTSKYVIGNWKLNPASLNEAKALAAAVKAALADQTEVKLGCAPGFLHLSEKIAAAGAAWRVYEYEQDTRFAANAKEGILLGQPVTAVLVADHSWKR